MEFKIKTDDKPNLDRLLSDSATKKQAMEVISTFVELMDYACNPDNSIPWIDLPKKFSQELTFKELIHGILKGSLDLKDIDPEAYDVIKEEVHPLSMLTPRWNHLEDKMIYKNWRSHFRLPKDSQVNQETIAAIFRKLLRYYKYVNVESLASAIINNQVATFQSMDQAKLLPFYPALRYQQETKGDLAVGKFLDEIGSLDCGTLHNPEDDQCPACKVDTLNRIGNFLVCPSCNGGWRI
jgi:hypothetical protein